MFDKEIYSEVRCDYNNEEGFWCVDAWRTTDENEEGKVIAFIHEETGDVAFVDNCARWSKMAMEVINSKIAEIKNS